MLRNCKNCLKTFISKEYSSFDSSRQEFRRRILKSLQVSLSIVLIIFMVSTYPFQKYPVEYYIHFPLLFVGNNLFSTLLLRVKKFERFITSYICVLLLAIPVMSFEVSLSLITETSNVSNVKAFFVGIQIGLLYSIAFLTLSASLHKFLMTLFFLGHLLLKQYMTGNQNVVGTYLVITSIFIFVNYIYYRNEMLNLGIWTSLMRKNEGLRHFEKLIEIFPSQILVLDRKSLESDTALYFNIDAQKLRDEVLSTENQSVNQFLDRFQIAEATESEGLIKYSRTLKTVISKAFENENSFGLYFGNDFQTYTSYLKSVEEERTREKRGISVSTYKHDHERTQNKWEVKIGSIEWAQKDALIIIFNDISKSEKIRELKMLDENKDKLLATVSHELRTPLNGIIGMIDVTCEELDSPEKVKSYLEVARNSAKNLLYMINDILDISQIRRGNLRLKLVWTDLMSVIENVLPLIKVQVKAKNLEFLFENKCPQNTFVLADPIRLQQILLNLLGNACKFTSVGYVKLEAAVIKRKDESDEEKEIPGQKSRNSTHHQTEKEHLVDSDNVKDDEENLEFVELSVEDSGKGIREDRMGNLFQLFGKIETEGNTTGVGLGLAISQGLAKKMQSSGIEVESVFGQGSRFSFKLQACFDKEIEGKAIPDESPSIHNIKSNRCFKKRKSNFLLKHTKLLPTRVLVVDDDLTNHMVIELYLKALADKNIIADKAFNGLEAVNIVEANARKEEYYKLIIMDCDMPIMNGFQACVKLKEIIQLGSIPEVKIVALTANASLADKELCIQHGMEDVWTKPISRIDFIKKFNELVD